MFGRYVTCLKNERTSWRRRAKGGPVDTRGFKASSPLCDVKKRMLSGSGNLMVGGDMLVRIIANMGEWLEAK